MTCTASDLINIQPLALSDTFNTWFDRTNEVIGSLNYLNIYDIGQSGGINIDSGCSAAYYNGLAFISVDAGAGIGIGSAAFGGNTDKVVIDAKNLENLGTGATSNPAVDDYIIVADISDTRQGPSGTPKRTTANRMLPPIVTFGDSGNGSFTIQGDVNIVGNLNVSDTVSYIDSNDLRIEDKVIELALNRYVEFLVEASGGLTAGSFLGGQTAYYIDSGTPTPSTATSIGLVREWKVSTGVTGYLSVNAFIEGGVSDFANNGRVVVTGAAITESMRVSNTPAIFTDYFNDELLTPAGIDIKGASGDKTFLWNYRTPDLSDTWNAFMANTNLGVTGSANSVISSRFSSYGYNSATDNTFTFEGQGSSYSKFAVGTELSMEHSPAGAAGVTFGIVAIGSTGTTYPNAPVYAWVKRFNADQLDGAHASTAAAAWTIPVSLTDGRVHEDFIRADGVRKVFSVANSGFEVGDVVRINSSGGLTFAKADTVPTAEVFGMVETVHGNRISVVSEGFISGLNGTRINAVKTDGALVTGNVYYLSQSVGGGLIANPDDGAFALTIGQVRKAVLLATDGNKGYVTAYAGTILGESSPTDFVYLPTVAPVGTIQPYMGSHTTIPDGWLLCDGKAIRPNSYPDLHEVIGQTYYATGVGGGDIYTVVLDGDTRNLSVGDGVQIVASNGTVYQRQITAIDIGTRTITVDASMLQVTTGSTVKVYGRTSTAFPQVFFLPDMRTRTILGTSFGTGLSGSGVINPQLALGNIGGNAYLPEHQHTIATAVQTGSGAFGASTAETGNPTTQVSNLPPYVTAHWIIRSKKTLPAIIITGHNHDNFYIRYDIPHTTGAGAANTLELADREQFRSNAMVLSKEGDDSTSGSLGVEGDLQVTGGVFVGTILDVAYTGRFGSNVTITGNNAVLRVLSNDGYAQDSWENYTPIGTNVNTLEYTNSKIGILGSKPVIALFSPTGGVESPYGSNGRISFYGPQQGSKAPIYNSSLGQNMLTIGATVPETGDVIGSDQYQFRIGFNLAGRASGVYYDESTFVQTRKVGDGVGDGSVRTFFPKSFRSRQTGDETAPVVIDTTTKELKIGSSYTPSPTFLTTPITVYNQSTAGNLNAGSTWLLWQIADADINPNATTVIVNWYFNCIWTTGTYGSMLWASATNTGSPANSYLIGGVANDSSNTSGTIQNAAGGSSMVPLDKRVPGTYSGVSVTTNQRLWLRWAPAHDLQNWYNNGSTALGNATYMVRIVGYI